MGLDMYLTAKVSLIKYSYDNAKNMKIVNMIFGVNEDTKINTLECEVLRWRNANAIHNWLISKGDSKNDIEDGEICISRKTLHELVELCHEVLADKKSAKSKLPVVSLLNCEEYDYDSHYFDYVAFTADRVYELLENKFYEYATFYYNSSW